MEKNQTKPESEHTQKTELEITPEPVSNPVSETIPEPTPKLEKYSLLKKIGLTIFCAGIIIGIIVLISLKKKDKNKTAEINAKKIANDLQLAENAKKAEDAKKAEGVKKAKEEQEAYEIQLATQAATQAAAQAARAVQSAAIKQTDAIKSVDAAKSVAADAKIAIINSINAAVTSDRNADALKLAADKATAEATLATEKAAKVKADAEAAAKIAADKITAANDAAKIAADKITAANAKKVADAAAKAIADAAYLATGVVKICLDGYEERDGRCWQKICTPTADWEMNADKTKCIAKAPAGWRGNESADKLSLITIRTHKIQKPEACPPDYTLLNHLCYKTPSYDGEATVFGSSPYVPDIKTQWGNIDKYIINPEDPTLYNPECSKSFKLGPDDGNLEWDKTTGQCYWKNTTQTANEYNVTKHDTEHAAWHLDPNGKRYGGVTNTWYNSGKWGDIIWWKGFHAQCAPGYYKSSNSARGHAVCTRRNFGLTGFKNPNDFMVSKVNPVVPIGYEKVGNEYLEFCPTGYHRDHTPPKFECVSNTPLSVPEAGNDNRPRVFAENTTKTGYIKPFYSLAPIAKQCPSNASYLNITNNLCYKE